MLGKRMYFNTTIVLLVLAITAAVEARKSESGRKDADLMELMTDNGKTDCTTNGCTSGRRDADAMAKDAFIDEDHYLQNLQDSFDDELHTHKSKLASIKQTNSDAKDAFIDEDHYLQNLQDSFDDELHTHKSKLASIKQTNSDFHHVLEDILSQVLEW